LVSSPHLQQQQQQYRCFPWIPSSLYLFFPASKILSHKRQERSQKPFISDNECEEKEEEEDDADDDGYMKNTSTTGGTITAVVGGGGGGGRD
jgi:hypothetical protein